MQVTSANSGLIQPAKLSESKAASETSTHSLEKVISEIHREIVSIITCLDAAASPDFRRSMVTSLKEISKNKDDYSCVNPIVNAAKSVLDLYKCSKWPEAKILGQTVKIAQADITKFWNEYVESENLGLSFRMSPRGVMSFPETRDDY